MSIVEIGIWTAMIASPFLVCAIMDCLAGDREMIRFLTVFIPCIMLIIFANCILVL